MFLLLILLLCAGEAYSYGFGYEIPAHQCIGANISKSEGKLRIIPLPRSLLDVTVEKGTSKVLEVTWKREVKCKGEMKSLILQLNEEDKEERKVKSPSFASAGIWEPRSSVTFSTGGFLQIGDELFNEEEFCVKGYSDTQLEISYCDEKCEDKAKLCIPKCCGPNQRLELGTMRCSAGSSSGNMYWDGLYKSPHTDVGISLYYDHESSSEHYMRFTRPSLTMKCAAASIRGMSFSDVPLGEEIDVGYLKKVMTDGSIMFQQSPVHWRRLRSLPSGSYCLDTFFNGGLTQEFKKFESYRTEDVHSLFWCPQEDEKDLRPTVVWEVTLLLISCLFYIVPYIVAPFSAKLAESGVNNFGVFALGFAIAAWNVIQVVCYLVYPFSGFNGDYLPTKAFLEFLLEFSFTSVAFCLLAINWSVHSSRKGQAADRENFGSSSVYYFIVGMMFILVLLIVLAAGIQERAQQYDSSSSRDKCFTDNDCRYYYVTILVGILWSLNIVFTVLNIRALKLKSLKTVWGKYLWFLPLIALVFLLELINYWGFGEGTPEWLWVVLIILKVLLGPWYFVCFWNIPEWSFTKNSESLELNGTS